MAFCMKCGKQLDDDAQFCPACGTRAAVCTKGGGKIADANGNTKLKRIASYAVVAIGTAIVLFILDKLF